MRTRYVRTVCAAAVTILVLACGPKQPHSPTPRELTLTEKMRMAESFRQAGRMHDALEILQEAIAERPEEARLHSLYGQYCFLAGRYPDAEQALLAALELDPYLTDARNWLGVTYAEQSRLAEAEREYRLALADPAYPTPEMVYLNLGLLYEKQGRDREAINALRRSVEIDPRFYKAHYRLARILERAGKLEEAAREYEVAEPAFRDNGEYHYRLGLVYFRLDRREDARESLHRCLAVAPGSPSAAEADELLRVMD